MAGLLQQATDAFAALGSRLRTDRTAAAVAGAVAAVLVVRWLVLPGGSDKNDDQTSFSQVIEVDTPAAGRKRVRRVTARDQEAAAEVLSGLAKDPMMIACSSEVRRCIVRLSVRRSSTIIG
jgi:hypothetical protein